MNSLQASDLVDRMMAAWPRAPWGDDTADEYSRWFCTLDHKLGVEVVERLIASKRRRPSIAECAEAAQATVASYGRAVATGDEPIPDPEPDWRLDPKSRELGREGVARLRRSLEAARERRAS